ncbi:hypothetical protein [Chryseobacterium sp. POE27]|uniref:hypothetical protein n=1 Tax=Chryseobacterium sp. POE27 TaxID=3138177 RepID=UPI00321A00A5
MSLKGMILLKVKFLWFSLHFFILRGETFEVSKDGNITNPDLLITEGEFAKNKIENMLPLDYQLGD